MLVRRLDAVETLAAVQVIVYAGAIVVLFLFVIMLLGVDKREAVEVETLRGQRPAAAGPAHVPHALQREEKAPHRRPRETGDLRQLGEGGLWVLLVEGEQDREPALQALHVVAVDLGGLAGRVVCDGHRPHLPARRGLTGIVTPSTLLARCAVSTYA